MASKSLGEGSSKGERFGLTEKASGSNPDPSTNLRPVSITDAELIYKWRQDDDLNKLILGIKFESVSEVERSIQSAINSIEQAYFIIESDKPVGVARLMFIHPPYAEIGIYLSKEESRGQGIGSKAFELLIEKSKTLGIKELFLRVKKSNIAAYSFYKKHGFVDFKDGVMWKNVG